MGSNLLSTALFVHPDHVALVEAHYALPIFIKNLPMLLSIGGAGFAILLYHRYPNVLVKITETRIGLAMYQFFNSK